MDKFTISYDEHNGVLILKIREVLDAEGLEKMVPEFEKLLEGKPRRYVLVDMSESSQFNVRNMTKEMRDSYKELINKMGAAKTAIYGASPALRMVSRIATAVSGTSDTTHFCKTKEEALAWLKGNTE